MIMRIRVALLSVCALLSLTAIRATAQCGPKMEKQIGDVRDSWVKNWNDQQLGNVANLYYKYADLLAADGSRAHGQDEIRAVLQKQMGSKVEVHSVAFACSDAFAYDNGTYTQTQNGQSVEGNYLVVLVWKDSKWQIVQHASTAKQPPLK
jgi:uncharacterized protein (TIGR02246 family)